MKWLWLNGAGFALATAYYGQGCQVWSGSPCLLWRSLRSGFSTGGARTARCYGSVSRYPSLRSSNWDCPQFSHHSSRRPSAERNARPSCRLRSQSVWFRLQEKRTAQKSRLSQHPAMAPEQRGRWCPETHTRRKARRATVIEAQRTKSRPSHNQT